MEEGEREWMGWKEEGMGRRKGLEGGKDEEEGIGMRKGLGGGGRDWEETPRRETCRRETCRRET